LALRKARGLRLHAGPAQAQRLRLLLVNVLGAVAFADRRHDLFVNLIIDRVDDGVVQIGIALGAVRAVVIGVEELLGRALLSHERLSRHRS
jgi:hypothetical protein